MGNKTKQVRVVRPAEVAETVGSHTQHILPCITTETCGAERVSAGLVTMPPGKVAKAHYHAHNEIVVVCFKGWAATLIGPELTPHIHGPGEFVYVPEGVIHAAVNLSETEELVAVEVRTDPTFGDDVVLVPEYDREISEVVLRLRNEFSQTSV